MNDSIQTVLFDFDGTLVFHEPDSFDVISRFCADIGQPLSAEAEYLGRRTRHEYFVDPSIRQKLSGMSSDEFWRHFNRYLLEAMGITGDLDKLSAAIQARFAELEWSHHCPSIGCRTLETLRLRGYGLGLITNRDNVERFQDLLDRVELRPYFDMILASGEVGIAKPEPGIFYAALARMGAKASESIYVGDNYWADVIGAMRASITPVLFDPRGLFPEAGCLVLDRLDDLLAWLP